VAEQVVPEARQANSVPEARQANSVPEARQANSVPEARQADSVPETRAADPSDADGPEALLAALDPEQRQVAMTTRGPVCVLAGAGTGKTRAVAHRIGYAVATGAVRPDHVLAVTFTTRAAGELRGRLRQLGAVAVPGAGLDRVQARTFHAAALRQLTHFWPEAVGGPPPAVLDSKLGLLAESARRLKLRLEPVDLRDVAAEIEWAKVTAVPPPDYPLAAQKADRTTPLPPDTLAALYAGYEELRRERHLVDFESVLELTAAILGEQDAVAQAVRDRYRYFVVDEYQDVNPLQKLLLDQWAGGRDDVCVVGDPRQTIYSFTGATPAYLTGFAHQYPGAAVIRLVRNYRSTPQVVHLANRVFGGLRQGPGQPAPAGGAAHAGLVAQRSVGPAPSLTEYPDEQAEVAGVVAEVSRLVWAGTPAREIAVLVRTNAMTGPYEQALAEEAIAFSVKGAERFYDRAEVRQAVGLLRAAARSAPGAAGDADPAPPAQVRSVLTGLGLSEQPPRGRGQARERWESLDALWQLASDFLAAPGATLADLAAELELRSAIGHAPDAAGITLASLHAAKGLEWDAVFLPGLTDGTVPIVYAQTSEAIEEERRLLYVGITRARQRVFLSWALARSPGGRRTRRPSRFLDGLTGPGPGVRLSPRASGRPEMTGAAGDGRRGSGRHLDHLEPAARQLFARLREWRLAAAADQGVPAYVIFSDATLAAIAERRPSTRHELAAIPGVGAVKLDRYGAAVLQVCAAEAQ
jgi:DNA helicase II / ATP-dependent DNA helicase PcrA